ncbi:hypothetical protein, partial [Paraburkholderia phenoliruptrix]|uniref:hypothetical protein n=1 Tax=Paraburkholderia phenoliruptrix TaxID=252970 RepID=UPI001ABA0F95
MNIDGCDGNGPTRMRGQARAPRMGNVPQTVEGWDGGCGIDYATLRSWSMLDFEGERFRAAASTQ